MEDSSIQQNNHRNRRFWIPVIASVPVTIICLIVSMLTTDFGFETCVAAMIFFPYTMLSTLWFGVIPPALGIITLFQRPLYGIIIGRAWVKGKLMLALEVLLVDSPCDGSSGYQIYQVCRSQAGGRRSSN